MEHGVLAWLRKHTVPARGISDGVPRRPGRHHDRLLHEAWAPGQGVSRIRPERSLCYNVRVRAREPDRRSEAVRASEQGGGMDERAAAERLLYQLRSVGSYRDAIQLAERRPAKSDPSRAMHARFGTFVQSFEVPPDAGLEEALEYARLFECFVTDGAVRKDTVAHLRGQLQRSIAARRPSPAE